MGGQLRLFHYIISWSSGGAALDSYGGWGEGGGFRARGVKAAASKQSAVAENTGDRKE